MENIIYLLIIIAFFVIIGIRERKNPDSEDEKKRDPVLSLLFYTIVVYTSGFASYYILRGKLENLYFHDDAILGQWDKHYEYGGLAFFVSTILPPLVTVIIWNITVVNYKISFFKHLFLVIFYIILNFSYYYLHLTAAGEEPSQEELKKFRKNWTNNY